MEDCVVNIDQSGRSIKGLVRESLRTVNIGDVLRSFRERANELWINATQGCWDATHLNNGEHTEVPKRLFGDQAKKFLQLVLSRVPLKQKIHHHEIAQVKLAKEQLFSDMETRICWSSIAAHEKLKSSGWILENPGRQWTGSHDLIIEHPRDWYGNRYRSFKIGCESVETTLRLIRRFTKHWLHVLPIDIFKIIVREVVWENSYLAYEPVMTKWYSAAVEQGTTAIRWL
jgi:hypothetical protein